MPETSQTWPCQNVKSALTTVEGSCKVQLRLRLDQADSYTTHQGESKHCCHPGQPIQSVGHKSARRPSSFGSGKMECDGLVFTNSGGAPSLRQASHHSTHSAEPSLSPHSIWFGRIEPPPLPISTPPSFYPLRLPTQTHLLCFSSCCPPLSFHQCCSLVYIVVIK